MVKGWKIKQKSLHDHFLRDSFHNFEEDINICLIDKTNPSEPHKKVLLDEDYLNSSTFWTKHQRKILNSICH